MTGSSGRWLGGAIVLALGLCVVEANLVRGAAGLTLDLVVTGTTGAFSASNDHSVGFTGALGSPGADTISMDVYALVSGTNLLADEGFQSLVVGRLTSE